MSGCTSNFSAIVGGFYNSQFIYKKGTVSPNRKIVYYELEYFPESGGISYVNGIAYPVAKGNVLCAVPGSMRHSVLHFKAHYVKCKTDNPILISLLRQLPVITAFGENDVLVKKLFQQISWHCDLNDPVHMLYAEAKLLELLFRLINKNQLEGQSQISNPLIRQAVKFIDLNYQKDIKLESIAKEVGLTPVYFHNLFMKTTGQTPHEYLLEKRLSAAKELLTGSDMSLVNVAAECGFSSQSYFNAVFKKYSGTTPLKYRQQAFDKYQL